MTKKPGQPGFFMRGDFFCALKPQGAVPNATADESDPLPPGRIAAARTSRARAGGGVPKGGISTGSAPGPASPLASIARNFQFPNFPHGASQRFRAGLIPNFCHCHIRKKSQPYGRKFKIANFYRAGTYFSTAYEAQVGHCHRYCHKVLSQAKCLIYILFP